MASAGAAVPITPPDRPRWAQLTYSSFDRHDGQGGGWQVKDTSGDLDQQERELLRGRVQTQYDPGVEVPRFPTPAQVEELPRRFVHAEAGVHDAETAVWHLVPAGNDASGRPGNVFAHVVLDRNPSAPHPLRPIERWRSADWLTPFGPQAVLAAKLTDSEPPKAGPLRRHTIASWLFAPRTWRMQVLPVLLDAVRAAMGEGPPVVLGVPDLDTGANWIAAVSFAMSAGTSRRLYFSTSERPNTLSEAWRHGVHLAVVLQKDLPALAKSDGCVVVDTSQTLALGDLDGQPHQTARGDRIPVTEWSELIAELFAGPQELVQAVADLDEVAHTVGDIGLDPAWPAAMLLSRRPDADSRSEAQRVMATCAPPQLRANPHLYASAVTALREEVDGSAEAAWAHLEKQNAHRDSRSPSVAGEVAVRIYAELALADEPWLAASGPARVPSRNYYTPTPEPELVHRAALLAEHISAFAPEIGAPVMLEEARAGLHFLELTLRLGLAHDDRLAPRLWRICQETLIPVLLSPELGGQLVQSVDLEIIEELRHWLWTQLLEAPIASLAPPGQRVADSVLVAVGPGPDDPDPLAAAVGWLESGPQSARLSPLLGELAFARLRGAEGSGGQPRDPGNPDESLDNRFHAVWAGLEAYAAFRDSTAKAAVARFLEPVWPMDRMALLDAGFGDRVPMKWYSPALVSAGDTTDGLALWTRLATRDDDSLAAIRVRFQTPHWIPEVSPDRLETTLTVLGEEFTRVRQVAGLIPDRRFLHQCEVLVVLGLLAARGRTPELDHTAVEALTGPAHAAILGLAGATRLPPLTQSEAEDIAEWCDRIDIETTALAELLLLADPRSALRNPDDRVAGWLHAVSAGDQEGTSIVAHVLARRVSRNADSREEESDLALRAARTAPGSADERASRQSERFLSGWLRAQTGRTRW